jgi:CheY-like chemotaxis protein
MTLETVALSRIDQARSTRTLGLVLVISHDPDEQALIASRLRRLDYSVAFARDVDEGLSRLVTGYYDVCLLISGDGDQVLEALPRIRAMAPDTRLVWVTTHVDDSVLAGALNHETGAHALLQKPLETSDLKRCMDTVLRRKGKFLRAL